MKRLFIFILLSCFFLPVRSQWTGKVIDAASSEPLSSASIILFSSGKRTGLVANKEGFFSVSQPAICDSMRVSMVGYGSKTISAAQLSSGNHFEIRLEPVPAELSEVVIKKKSALDIIQKAIAVIPSFQPAGNFECKSFYREIIRDREHYFSVAEAVFLIQYSLKKESCKLQLLQGRSKEDVAYTRLFEDYHPGDGPQSAAEKNFATERPDFLDAMKIKYFTYKIDSLVRFDDGWLYSISFDQKAEVKQALEKGRLLIDADDFGIVRYEAENSPLGTPYIKHLTGSDKIFAELLNIDFKRKGWKHRVDFSKADDKWLLSYVGSERKIGYRQPAKNIDLDLTVITELLITDLQSPVVKEITKEEQWKQKNMMINLPSAFDQGFWGANNILSPTKQVKSIVEAISKDNKEKPPGDSVNDWQYMNRNYFASSRKNDTITIIPVMKCWWDDEKNAGMLYKEMQGDFSAETKINIVKNSIVTETPDKGFQQGGILIRSNDKEKGDYVFLSIGTAGNPGAKLVFKKTSGNRSKTFTDKIETMSGWLRLVKKDKKITAWYKNESSDSWKKTGEYEADWLGENTQLGLAVYAGFSGTGPKMQPDMKAEFFQIKIELQ